jgi:type IV pilus assembly protein PilQ
MKMSKIVHYVGIVALGYLSLTFNLAAQGEETVGKGNRIEQIDFATLPGDKLNIKVKLTHPMADPPAGFTMTNPARIALDFPNTASGLNKNALSVNQGALRSLNIAQGKNRTRLVLNLTRPSSYAARVDGNTVSIDLQSGNAGTAEASGVTRFAEPQSSDQRHHLSNVDFMRGKNGEGRVVVELSDSATGIDIRQQGQKILVDFIDADLPESLQRRLNVIDFGTPVLNVDTMRSGKNVRMTIEPKGLWEHSAYQADRKFIIDVRPLVEDPNKLTQGSKTGYKGEKLSLNFQDIEVRSVLQVIADFTGFNIITSDSVSGKLTLRLKDVPWDQALDLIMQTRGLGMRKNGNVVWIAPNEELAAKEKSRLDAEQEIADRVPLVTQSFKIKYQKAEDVRSLLIGRSSGGTSGGAGGTGTHRLLSKRGTVAVDKASNTLFVQDTEKILSEIESIINQIDVATRQVLIESRIVVAQDGWSKDLGVRFGVQRNKNWGDEKETAGSTVGGSLGSIYNTNETGVQTTPENLNVNLPALSPFAGVLGLQFYNILHGFLLDLELSAAEAENKTKTISSPRVITANQQKAVINSGVEIPYQEASSSGATSVSFKQATLGLEVTPQITPDNKISMDLLVKKDSVGEEFNGVPSINTNQVQTTVLVDNGETAVLGGIYEEETKNRVDKIPFFGDVPVLGNLFKRTSRTTGKNELLIFISPKLLDERLRAD